jgi:hypothetical protein
MNFTAYLQKKPREKKPRGRSHNPLSVRATADAIALSECLLYYAQELQRSGRKDLVAAVERGEMTVTGAVMKLHGVAPPDCYGKLVQAWNRCDEDERARFLTALEEAGMVTRSRSTPE